MQDNRLHAVTPIITNNQQSTCLSPTNSPNSPTFRRRKKTVIAVPKSPEELLMDSYNQLVNYIENIDEEVKRIVKGYEAQFLLAYRRHFNKVQCQFMQIRRQTAEAKNNHQHYVDKIQMLERQLVLFKQQSLNFSEKNNILHQEIQSLKIQIKQLLSDKLNLSKTISRLMKENKEAAVIISALKAQKGSTLGEESLNKTQMITNNTRQDRPMTMSVRMKSRKVQLGLDSIKKSTIDPQQGSSLQKQLTKQQKNQIFRRQMNRTLELHQDLKQRRQNFSERKTCFNVRQRVSKVRINTHRLYREQLKNTKSHQFAADTDYKNLYVTCVEEVKKQIMRKNGITGLNYFNKNGPKDFASFKNIDYHQLLFLFLKNEKVIHGIYDLIFTQR